MVSFVSLDFHCSPNRIVCVFVTPLKQPYTTFNYLHIDIVEFWGALAKVQVKLFVTRQGIPLLEKYGLLFVCGLSTIVFGAIEYFGPSQYCNLFSAIKYLVFAISVFGLSIRAAFFVRTIDRGILSLSGPETEGAGTGVNRSSLVWQLRFKFFVFFAVAISFSGYSLERAIYKFQRSWKCTPRTCNRKYVYNFPIPQVLYLIAAFAILLQFTNIAYCSSKTSFGSKSRSGSGNNQIPQQHEVKSTQIGLSDRVNQNLSLKKSYPSITNMSDIVAVKPN